MSTTLSRFNSTGSLLDNGNVPSSLLSGIMKTQESIDDSKSSAQSHQTSFEGSFFEGDTLEYMQCISAEEVCMNLSVIIAIFDRTRVFNAKFLKRNRKHLESLISSDDSLQQRLYYFAEANLDKKALISRAFPKLWEYMRAYKSKLRTGNMRPKSAFSVPLRPKVVPRGEPIKPLKLPSLVSVTRTISKKRRAESADFLPSTNPTWMKAQSVSMTLLTPRRISESLEREPEITAQEEEKEEDYDAIIEAFQAMNSIQTVSVSPSSSEEEEPNALTYWTYQRRPSIFDLVDQHTSMRANYPSTQNTTGHHTSEATPQRRPSLVLAESKVEDILSESQECIVSKNGSPLRFDKTRSRTKAEVSAKFTRRRSGGILLGGQGGVISYAQNPIEFYDSLEPKEGHCVQNQNLYILEPINIHRKQTVKLVVVQSIFKSNARPMLVQSYGLDSKLISRFILKKGDDLRRDEAVLQTFRFMSYIWQLERMHVNGVDSFCVYAKTYKCIAFTKSFGAIELVENCVPASNLNLRKFSENLNDTKSLNLIASGVGSFIACFVLGIRDRHFDNILIDKSDGTLFHIDFSHVLGDKLTGIDTSEIAVTKTLRKVMDDRWELFVRSAVNAYMALRKHFDKVLEFVISAFYFLDYSEDIISKYLIKSLQMEKSQEEARRAIMNKVQKSHNQFKTMAKNHIHSLAQRVKT